MPRRTQAMLTVSWGGEDIPVSNIPTELPLPPDGSDLLGVLKAGRDNPATPLPEGGWQAVARATVNPGGLARQLVPTADDPTGLLTVENVEGATLRSVGTRVFHSELLPGIQPRTGMAVKEVDDPQVQGVTEDGRPCAVIRYCYRDLAHLRNHVWDTLNSTLSINSYATSILGRKVSRNLIAHVVEIAFEDGTEPFYALAVRDGITRLASCWAVQAGPDAEPAEAASLAVQSLFGTVPAAAGGGSLGERLARHRSDWRDGIRGEFAREAAGEEPTLRAAQIGQTYDLPAQITLGAEGHNGHMLVAEDVFDDAMRSVLASVHVEFAPWDPVAQNVEVATRALKRVIQLGDSPVRKDDLQAMYSLAVGRIPSESLPDVVSADVPPPGTPLWRGVYLVNWLTRTDLFEHLKDQAKVIKGGKRMGVKGFAELLGPLIDLPWRTHKKQVTKQARNAWKNGGVLTTDVLEDWSPRPTDDFTTLVAPAMAGDLDARCTLAVAGGIALIADKLLTRNVGSAESAPRKKGGVPFRADVNLVVEGLSRQNNEEGLWILALAANRFRGDALPENAEAEHRLTRRERTGDEAADAYVHFKLDLDDAERIARDAVGVPEKLYEWDVVWASDPARAELRQGLRVPVPAPREESDAITVNSAESADTSPLAITFTAEVEAPRPASQRAADHRSVLRHSVTAARDALDQLYSLEPEVGGHTPIVSLAILDELTKQLVDLQTDVENLRRRVALAESDADDIADDIEDAEDASDSYA